MEPASEVKKEITMEEIERFMKERKQFEEEKSNFQKERIKFEEEKKSLRSSDKHRKHHYEKDWAKLKKEEVVEGDDNDSEGKDEEDKEAKKKELLSATNKEELRLNRPRVYKKKETLSPSSSEQKSSKKQSKKKKKVVQSKDLFGEVLESPSITHELLEKRTGTMRKSYSYFSSGGDPLVRPHTTTTTTTIASPSVEAAGRLPFPEARQNSVGTLRVPPLSP